MKSRPHGSRGYNIFEVLIAMAIMGVVMISIMTLFYMGRNNVYAGKQMTQAVSIGTQVLEDLSPLNKQMIYNGAFSITDTSAGYNVNIPAPIPRTYENVRIRSTNATLVPSPPSDIATENAGNDLRLLTKWKRLLAVDPAQAARGSQRLTNGSVTVVMIPESDAAGNDPEQFASARRMRVHVLVRWMESGRQRELILETVKVN